ncbi:hypothetical protein M5689_009040 [Euphorbia peplus]|nr:hypothetical protein M5689_009040 [Euphorbia peplus]
MVEKGAEMMQKFTPVKQMNQHVCTFAIYSHDMSRQIETHHFMKRLNQDFVQCAVYDSDDASAHLIGVEYIVSDKIFETLPPDEQKLWHSHAYEVKSGLLIHPRVPEMVAKPEMQNLAKSYGKFWCTWQVDKGDKLPLGPPALMVSPQSVASAKVSANLVTLRDMKYNIKTDEIMKSRDGIEEPPKLNPQADYWKQQGKGFVIELEQTEIKMKT